MGLIQGQLPTFLFFFRFFFTNKFAHLCLHAEKISWRELRVADFGLKMISNFSSVQRLHIPVTGEYGAALLTISN